jgi:hypothetical protein
MLRALLFVLLLIVASSKLFSQSVPDVQYCHIVATPNGMSSDLSVITFLFGQKNQSPANNLLKSFKDSLSIPKGQRLEITDALNIMAKLGWEVISVNKIDDAKLDERYIYLFKKPEL